MSKRLKISSETPQNGASQKSTKGFTLIELLVVLAVIGILAAIAIPAYNRYVDQATIVVAKSSLNSVRKTLELYHLEHNGYPTAPINFTTGQDNAGHTVFQNSQLQVMHEDFASIDSYVINQGTYILKVKANDKAQTILTLTPTDITY